MPSPPHVDSPARVPTTHSRRGPNPHTAVLLQCIPLLSVLLVPLRFAVGPLAAVEFAPASLVWGVGYLYLGERRRFTRALLFGWSSVLLGSVGFVGWLHLLSSRENGGVQFGLLLLSCLLLAIPSAAVWSAADASHLATAQRRERDAHARHAEASRQHSMALPRRAVNVKGEAWKVVKSYHLAYHPATREFAVYYALAGDDSAQKLLSTPSAWEFLALADMFRNEDAIRFNTQGRYFVSIPKRIA